MTKNILAAILKWFFFFLSKFYFNNINVFMFYFDQNLIEKCHWESGYSNFGHMTWFAKWKSILWSPFWNAKFLDFRIFFFWIMVVLDVYRYGESFVWKFLRESSLLSLGPSGPSCAQMGVKSSLPTYMSRAKLIQELKKGWGFWLGTQAFPQQLPTPIYNYQTPRTTIYSLVQWLL